MANEVAFHTCVVPRGCFVGEEIEEGVDLVGIVVFRLVGRELSLRGYGIECRDRGWIVVVRMRRD